MKSLRPPRPRPTITVGVTGHRRLEASGRKILKHTVDGVLRDLADACVRVVERNTDVFASPEFEPVLLSALAEGADQITAEAALERGWTLDAVLPFALDVYAEDFSGAPARNFRALLGRARRWWSLPSTRAHADEGYALVGQVTVAQSDVLIAVWDGHDARGFGGTADVVEYAIRRGVPVVWIHAVDGPNTIMWAGFDNLSPALLDRTSVPSRPFDAVRLDEIATRLLAPPREPEDRVSLVQFLESRQLLWRLRPEYPLLLAITGTRKLSRSSFWTSPYAEAAMDEWADFRNGEIAVQTHAPGLDTLEQAYGWSDSLASHYAQTYRGGMIFNYLAAALSVLFALANLLVPEAGTLLGIGELGSIAALIGNTSQGARAGWHRRWLDYRYLAERLRPMRSLRVLGAATPGFSLQATGVTKWTDWYARALWRQLPAPVSLANEGEVDLLAEHVATHELDSQIGYHLSNARRMHHLDHSLHQLGTALFYIAIMFSLYGLISHWTHMGIPGLSGTVLVFIAGALPTIGGALFGIRGHADFSGAAGRSESTAERLQTLAERLRSRPMNLATASRAAEDSASTMLSDLDEWQVSYRHRKLAIPA